MTDETTATAAKKPRRKVTLREMRERLQNEAISCRFHQDVMVQLAREEGTPFVATPDEYAKAEAFESAARVIDWILGDDPTLARLKEAAEQGAI
jgi:hypothetical protein